MEIVNIPKNQLKIEKNIKANAPELSDHCLPDDAVIV